MKTKFSVLFFVLLCLTASQAWGHHIWLNMTNHTPALWQHQKYAPEPRAKTVVYVGWGDFYPLEDFMSDRFWGGLHRIEPDGTRVEMETVAAGYRAVRHDMYTVGPRIFAAQVKPAFFDPVKEREGFFRVYYEQYAKALVSVLPQDTTPLDAVDSDSFTSPIGQKVEIVPSVNPNRLQPGDTLQVQVLVEGAPAADFEVYALNLASPNAKKYETRTDEAGKATLRLETFYGPWIVTARHGFPATGEIAEKAETVSYTATMTFALPYVAKE
ncbi:DUF4198 domain-containing protein [Geoalkalibacter halelectricus]|uniref:DUF4198 domain-containing protein n=1 Tax=Geoalkalibacter halelectricus TaxID=2847045 RepID=UPI00266F925E|nr:DUF4198 domain-containing protein [Geoalkalibacter halelectricus]MDO3380325.1 DUF4198 domain-containing protein [Geoalkalibacter halelectricus]